MNERQRGSRACQPEMGSRDRQNQSQQAGLTGVSECAAPVGTHVRHATASPLLDRMQVNSLVIFRALQLGDMLCAVPALRALRARLPCAHITLVGLPWAKQFAARFSCYIDDFVAFPGHFALPEQLSQPQLLAAFQSAMDARKFDLAIQMHGDGSLSNVIVRNFNARAVAGFGKDGQDGAFMPWPEDGAEPLRLLRLAEFLGAPALRTDLEFPITAADVAELSDSGLGTALEPGRYICVHPGARHADKRWAPENFAEVADRLVEEYGLGIVITGSADESALAESVARHMHHPAVNAAAPISIGAMAALMKSACLLLCNDTGVSHIAAGLALPSVVVFTNAELARWSPLNQELHRSVRSTAEHCVSDALAQARLLLRRDGGVDQKNRYQLER